HLLALDQQLASFAEWYSTLERMRVETETKMASLRAQLRAVDTLREHLVTGLLDSSLYRIPQARVLWDSLVVLRTEYVSLRIQGIDTTGARMQDLRRRIRETETQLSALLQQSLRARIWGDPAVLLDSLQRVQMDSEMMLLGIHAEQEALLRLQAQYEQVLDTLPDQAARYVRFQAKYQYLLAFLTGLRAQHDQLRILAAYPVSAYYTVQSPHIPGDPVSPKPILIFAVAVFVGVLSGTGVAVAYELMRNRVEHPDDLRDYGAPILAVVSSTMRKEDFVALAPVIARLERWLASSSSHPGILLWAGWIPMNAYVHWVEGLSGTPDRIPGIGMVWLTSPVATLDSHEGVEIVEPEEVMYRVLETPSSDVLIVHPADHPMDPVLQSLLVTSDAAVLVVRRGMSMDVVDQWMSLMGASGTEFLGWIFLQD
ncbi:MAG: hypothetical protein L3J76_06010, partial [Candidatus Hydrothermae bacterium]|nr:hypothetical protein [Candidatus Hydrothermae bacterium]